MSENNEKAVNYKANRVLTKELSTLLLDFPTSRIYRNDCCLGHLNNEIV